MTRDELIEYYVEQLKKYYASIKNITDAEIVKEEITYADAEIVKKEITYADADS